MRILVTGSRAWAEPSVVTAALHSYWVGGGSPKDAVLVHGNAPGADRIARNYWRSLRLHDEPYLADWSNLGSAAGPVRNQAMVDSGADVCIGFPIPNPDGKRSGTVDCMDRAHRAGIQVVNLGTYPWEPCG